MWLDLTSSNNRAHMEAIVSRTRGRDGKIIRIMDGEIIRIPCHHPKRANNHKKRRWIWKKN